MASEEVVAEVLSHVIGRQGPAPNIMKTVKVLKERKIADRTLLHLHGDDRSWRKPADSRIRRDAAYGILLGCKLCPR
ncbi:hypothetical protein [Sinorhizobium sp. BG8]|uniref:hypothetical protein n=1 Tax=Sinorhizobium sp. BG8 TaxID=2613773 RepID=UPI00193CD1F5|nr:hypothetical protein [Sinorhizobium sp. BG8]QRM55222.1 hypothetical protein F3Y30_12250 [Sinorhizobium sp. BG8]